MQAVNSLEHASHQRDGRSSSKEASHLAKKTAPEYRPLTQRNGSGKNLATSSHRSSQEKDLKLYGEGPEKNKTQPADQVPANPKPVGAAPRLPPAAWSTPALKPPALQAPAETTQKLASPKKTDAGSPMIKSFGTVEFSSISNW